MDQLALSSGSLPPLQGVATDYRNLSARRVIRRQTPVCIHLYGLRDGIVWFVLRFLSLWSEGSNISLTTNRTMGEETYSGGGGASPYGLSRFSFLRAKAFARWVILRGRSGLDVSPSEQESSSPPGGRNRRISAIDVRGSGLLQFSGLESVQGSVMAMCAWSAKARRAVVEVEFERVEWRMWPLVFHHVEG